MTRWNFYRATLFLLIVFLSTQVHAQSRTTVKAGTDRQQILIGEQIVLTLEADIPENEPIRFFQIDSIPHFEILSQEKIDTSNTGYGTVLKQRIHITSFDSGRWVIPQMQLGAQALTDSMIIDVGYTAGFDPTKPYHDIRDIIEVKPEEVKKDDKKWWYIGGGALLLLLIILYFIFRKKKPAPPPPAPPPIDPFKDAMDKLAKLNEKKADPKTYYSDLVDIFRIYVLRKKGIHSLQNTTDDLVKQLQSLGLAKNKFNELSQALRTSDMVKFAKYVPTSDDDHSSFEAIRQSIQSIEELNG